MARDYSNERNSNYNAKKKEPARKMGEKDFANLPKEPMVRSFSGKHGYRDGIINCFTCDIDDFSGISENEK